MEKKPIMVVHAVNTIGELLTIPHELGVEIDIRNDGKKLILHHDPFENGDLFEDYCANYKHKFMLLNVKTEGIENEVLDIVKRHGIRDYFFLDITFPAILKLLAKGEKNIAVRFSEFETLENSLALKGKVNWVWVDTFTKLPLTKNAYKKIRRAGFKIFLVSPERWGQPQKIEKYKKYLEKNKIHIDAIMCSKGLTDRWSG
ncbi:MAG TPA: hypothetical protein VJG83_04955 [archaeon]|nr:hypothetical protein [archaeon]